MPGGLVEIASYGNQDLYLTGVPEITFFKVVYRRHTNFSLESIPLTFDDPVGFGRTSNLAIKKTGDLLHKIYLEITLPEMNLKRQIIPDFTNLEAESKQAEKDLETVKTFLNLNKRAYVAGFSAFVAENTLNSDIMITETNRIFEEPGAEQKSVNFEQLLSSNNLTIYLSNEISLNSIVSGFDASNTKTDIFSAMTVGIDKSIKLQDVYFKNEQNLKKTLEDAKNKNIKFAWIDKIGHAIFEYVDVKIGGYRMDKITSDWINVWHELSQNKSMSKTYDEMIGHVTILTNFDRNKKPSYVLRIPMQFWFCRYSGLSIPLISLEYHDVSFEVKFRNLENLSFIEEDNLIKFRGDNGLRLDEYSSETRTNFDARILADFIYLDRIERKKFALSSHEYLIDQIQTLEIDNVTQPSLQCSLKNFFHPVKDLVWVANKTRYRENLDGFDKSRYNNYSLTDDNKGNIINTSSMSFHGKERLIKLDYKYYNYLIPYEMYNATPSDGINAYSFSLFPLEHQPSGSSNFTILSRIVMNLEFSPKIITGQRLTEPIDLKIFARNINVIRFMSGMAAPAFTYG